MTENDRREFQRLRLAKPILGLMAGQSALILDIGIAGAFVEHYGQVQLGDRFQLSFRWQGQDIEFESEVIRTNLVREATPGNDAVSHSGLRFHDPVGDSAARMQEMMINFVGRLLSAQRANASAQEKSPATSILTQMGDARRLRTRGFVTYRWNGSGWTITRGSDTLQPADGFTVAGYEDEEDLEELCRTWEQADEEGRQLIRVVAELSVLSARK